MPFKIAKKSVRSTWAAAKAELPMLAKISWIYAFFGCLLTLSENYYYAYMHDNALWEHLNDYWMFAFVFCPAAKAVLAAINIASVYKYLLGSHLGFTNIVIRRELIADTPTLALPIYFSFNWRIVGIAVFIIAWELSTHYIRNILPFKMFPDRSDAIFRAEVAFVSLFFYSLALTQIALVFPYTATSKNFSPRQAWEQLKKLHGSRLDTWMTLSIFSLFYAVAHDVLRGPMSQKIPFRFYHDELFINLRYCAATIVWFIYLNLMTIFSAAIYKKTLK